jgi:hypothetical protein
MGVPRRIFGCKEEELTGVWRKPCNGELNICTRHVLLVCDRLVEVDMGVTFGMHGRNENCLLGLV